MVKISRPKAEKILWTVEKYTLFIIVGVTLMFVARFGEEYINDFYPWDFVAGGLWIGFVNWRRGIR